MYCYPFYTFGQAIVSLLDVLVLERAGGCCLFRIINNAGCLFWLPVIIDDLRASSQIKAAEGSLKTIINSKHHEKTACEASMRTNKNINNANNYIQMKKIRLILFFVVGLVATAAEAQIQKPVNGVMLPSVCLLRKLWCILGR